MFPVAETPSLATTQTSKVSIDRMLLKHCSLVFQGLTDLHIVIPCTEDVSDAYLKLGAAKIPYTSISIFMA
jgi:hypothetical protein